MIDQPLDPRAPDPQEPGGPEGQLSAALLQRLFTRISEVSALPEVALRIVSMANDPDVEADDLLEAVRSDPALAMRLMRTVNSSYYALVDKVSNLKQAITLLGFKEVRNLALTSYVAQMFQETSGHGRYHRRDLWDHMVGAAMVARLIARTCRRVPPEEAYLAGLLHDLGLVLIDQYVHRAFCRVVDSLTEEVPLCEVEAKILGFNHAQLGEFVASRWALPVHLATAIGYHHTPDRYHGPDHDIVFVVALADFFCCLKGLTSLGMGTTQDPPLKLFARLGLRRRQVESLLAQLDEVLTAADAMALVQVPDYS